MSRNITSAFCLTLGLLVAGSAFAGPLGSGATLKPKKDPNPPKISVSAPQGISLAKPHKKPNDPKHAAPDALAYHAFQWKPNCYPGHWNHTNHRNVRTFRFMS